MTASEATITIKTDRRQVVGTAALATATVVGTYNLIKIGSMLMSPALRRANDKLAKMANKEV